MSDIHQKTIINIIRRLQSRTSGEHASRMDVDSQSDTASSVFLTNNEHFSAQIQEIYETINILASGIQTLNDDAERLSSESLRLSTSIEMLNQEVSTLKLGVQEQGAFLDDVKQNQEILQQDIASLKQKIDDMQYVSYDGTLIWRIANFNEKMSKFNS